ncbi:MAG: hypothetical protein H7332_03290 [Bdellovibrionales bacterium]|nr:hypothetical protein [Ramlibacter sp.]
MTPSYHTRICPNNERKLKVFYRPEMSAPANDLYSPSAFKPKLVVEDWLANAVLADAIEVQHFSPAQRSHFDAVHHPDYVDGVMGLREPNGFGTVDAAIAATFPYTVGSMVSAAKYVLSKRDEEDWRMAISPTSGFHHAGYNFGGGYCTFNGLMAAAVMVYTLGLAKRILIIDMDHHYGNGTDDIIKKLGLAYVTHITAVKSYKTADEAFGVIGRMRKMIFDRIKPDLVLYQAGADMHVDDPLGGIMTTEQMMHRDQTIIKGCSDRRIPLVWNLAGGYQRDVKGTIEPVLKLHRNTVLTCLHPKVMAMLEWS